MVRPLCVVVVASLLAGIAAQERRPAFVIAMDAQGRPVAGATITCFASPTFAESSDEVDLVDGVTDERGRVVAKLLAHRVYSAFAILPGDAGQFLASETHENVAAGAEVVLRVVVERHAQRLVIEGQAAWQHVGPLAVAIAPEADNRLLLPVQDGQVPRLPSIGCVLVRDAQGQPLWSHAVLPHRLWRKPGEQAEELRDPLVVKLPAPHALGVRVCGPGGKPVANAELWQAIEQMRAPGWSPGPLPHPAWRWLGRTGDDGTAKVQVASAADDGMPQENLLIQVRAAGHSHGVGGVAYGRVFDGRKKDPTLVDGALSITLEPAQKLHVDPPGAYTVTVFGRRLNGPVKQAGEEGPLPLRTDAAGVAAMPLVQDADALRVARIERTNGEVLWSIVTADDPGSRVSVEAREMRVLATDAAGKPARGQHVVIIPWVRTSPGFDLPMPLDHAGRTTVRLGNGTWFFWCCDGRDAAWRVVEVGEQDVDVALPMQPIPCASVRFLDADRKPRIGYRVQQWPSFEWDAQPSKPNRFLIERQVGLSRAGMRHDTTDADGCLHYLMLPLPDARLRFGGSAGLGAHGGRGAVEPGGIESGKRTDHVIE